MTTKTKAKTLGGLAALAATGLALAGCTANGGEAEAAPEATTPAQVELEQANVVELDPDEHYFYAKVHNDYAPWVEGWAIGDGKVQFHTTTCADLDHITVQGSGTLTDDGTIEWSQPPLKPPFDDAAIETITPDELVLLGSDRSATSDLVGETESLAELCRDAGYNMDSAGPSDSGGEA